MAGYHAGVMAMAARSTSLPYSPRMSAVNASNRVNPSSAVTSRNRWTWTTASMAS